MPTYSDRRSRYSGVPVWEAANVIASTPAQRGPSPRDNFRVVTADTEKTESGEWVQGPDGTWAKDSKQVALPSPVSESEPQSQSPSFGGVSANESE